MSGHYKALAGEPVSPDPPSARSRAPTALFHSPCQTLLGEQEFASPNFDPGEPGNGRMQRFPETLAECLQLEAWRVRQAGTGPECALAHGRRLGALGERGTLSDL